MPSGHEQKIKSLLESILSAKVPADDAPLCLLPGWDSLRHAEFILALQKEFGRRFSPTEIAAFTDLNAVYKIIASGSD